MMVYRFDSTQLLVVLQIDHSRVAGLIAAHWGNSVFAEPRPFTSMVLAAQEHDNGWWDWEIKPTMNDEGWPIDYITGGGISRAIHTAFDTNGINRVARRDPYAALLVSMHLAGLNTQGFGLLPYLPDRRQVPVVQEFLREQEQLRNQLLQDLRGSDEFAEFSTDEYVWMNYRLLTGFDQLAQFICNRHPFNSTERQNGPPSRLPNVPLGAGQEDVTTTIRVLGERRAVIQPYPFDVDPLEVSFPARLMPMRPYGSEEKFLRDFYKAERRTISYTVQSASTP